MQRGFPLLRSACRRAFERRAELDAYHAQQLFGPVSYWGAAWKFLQLQMPQHVHVDLREFLDGAAFAGTQQQLTARSRAFVKFALSNDAASKEEDGGNEAQHTDQPSDELLALFTSVDDAASTAAGERLEAMCTPQMFSGTSKTLRRALREKSLLVEVQELKIDTIAVTGVFYMQLTESDCTDLANGSRSLSAPSSPDATLEHLVIQVRAQTTEIHKMTLVGQEVALVEQQNNRLWVFESGVTDPDSLDWRMLGDHGTNISARELEPRQYLNGSGPSHGATG